MFQAIAAAPGQHPNITGMKNEMDGVGGARRKVTRKPLKPKRREGGKIRVC